MSKKIFHKNLYKEKCKQLRLIGFIAVGLLSLIAILLRIGVVISITNSTSIYTERYNVDIMGDHIYLYLIFTVIVPLLALTCFHFLTQRNSSDFYHSLPHTRTCVYVCSLAAIVTWTTLIVWVPTLISGLFYTILSQFFVVDIWLLLRFALFIYIASLLVIAGIALACSMTGTLFTNIIVTGMILFLPRIFIYALTTMITGTSSILVDNHLFPLLDVQYNIIFGLTTLGHTSTSLNLGGLLYSLILTIVYLFLGLLLFKRRKSEAANQAAVSRRVQTIIRLVLGLTVSLIPISVIFNRAVEPEAFSLSELPVMIYTISILYLLVCGVMLLYEVISTKKLKNIIKALPSIGILAVINVLIILFTIGIYHRANSFSPDVDEIDYVVIEDSYLGSYDEQTKNYLDVLLNSIEYTDKDILTLVSDTLKENIKTASSSRYGYSENEFRIVVGIHSGLTTKYRRLTFPEKDYKALVAAQKANKEYIEAYQNLPILSGNNISIDTLSLTNKENKELYDIAREEIKSLDFSNLQMVFAEGYSSIGDIIFYTTVNNESARGTISLCGYLPKTCAKYLEFAQKSQAKDLTSIVTVVKEILTKKKDVLSTYPTFDVMATILDIKNNVPYSLGLDNNSLFQYADPDSSSNVSKELLEALVSSTKDYSTFDPTTDYLVKIDFYASTTSKNIRNQYVFVIEKSKLSNLVDSFSEEPSYVEEVIE